MSTDDSILRLQNALVRLAELSVNHEERIARLEEMTARLQESTERLQESTARLQDSTVLLQESTTRLQDSFGLLVELARNQDERLDELRAAQTESARKIAALADAHIRTEEALAQLTAKVDVIIDIIQGGAGGRSPE